MKNIKDLRKAKGWTQIDLAREAGVNQSTISKMEAGETMGLSTLREVADALDVPVAQILDEGAADTRGFAEAQPKIDMSKVMDRADTELPPNTATDDVNQFKIAQVGNLVQVAGTYDKAGLLKLAKRLEAMSEWLEDE